MDRPLNEAIRENHLRAGLDKLDRSVLVARRRGLGAIRSLLVSCRWTAIRQNINIGCNYESIALKIERRPTGPLHPEIRDAAIPRTPSHSDVH
jgi:hypothetical protein